LVDVNPFPLGTNTRIYNTPYPSDTYSYLSEFQNITRANYNAAQVRLQRQYASLGSWGSAFFTFGYTWSHEIDNVSGFRQRNFAVPAYNHELFRASGDTDVRHIVTFSGGWELPFDHLWQRGPKLLTSGWTLYPIFIWRTGFPLDVFANINTTRTDPSPSGAGDGALVHADYVAPVITMNPKTFQTFTNPNSSTTQSGNYYFNPAIFSNANLIALDNIASTDASKLPYFTYGSFPRNAMRGPGQTNLDIAISKHFRIREKYDVELRMDAFNVFNHTEFQNPDQSVFTITTPTFGQITTTYPSRILQLALHFAF
jgi:hypothetical protein